MSLGWPGNALGSPRRSWRRCLGEGRLGVSAESAAPATQSRIKRKTMSTSPMKAGSGTGTSRLHGRVTDGVQRCRSLESGQVLLGEAESMESNGCQQSLTGNLGKEGEVR
ncbi:hypothetical protein ATANTOWER_012822 [Ataeniobius toweri]|uniref:Uncharacterized protein n=1 Tax=Ataeniobius toweri TaxID=208326 RepID=A0ABU7C7X1_9TELE|nr:hypothetical protein [Ataeniobius toweri]